MSGMKIGVRIAILLVTIGAIATATWIWTRSRMSDEEREIRGAQELLEQLANEPEMKAMLQQMTAAYEKKVSARRPVPPEMKLSAEEIDRERTLLTAEIHAAFKDVSREGGVSWSESEVIDGYGTDEEQAAARAQDKDTSWTQLVDDQNWNSEPGIGGFSFMDAIGYRYYLPAAMIRCIRSGYDEGIQFHLTIGDRGQELRDYNIGQLAALDPRQRQCVARFLRYMIAVSAVREDDQYEAKAWLAALDSYWGEAQ
jgi:hypothetical protein